MPVQQQFEDIESFVSAWSEWAATVMSGNELADNGQLDDIPYELWEMNVIDWRTF